MIDAWTTPAFVAVLLGGIAFVALFVPILVWESRRYGQIRFNRVVGAGMVAIYAVAVVAYTLLPLPDSASCAANRTPGVNLDPGQVVRVNLRYLHAHGFTRLVRSFDFLQAVFNIALFVPWGALARRYFGMRAWTALLSGFVASVAIEVAQGTALFGLAPCVYRVADVDDVILNTLGAGVGALLAPVVLFFVADARLSGRTRGHPRPVTRRRRLVAMLIDGFAFVTLPAALIVAWRLGALYGLGRPLPTEDAVGDSAAVLFAFVVLLLPTLIGSGGSIGQRAMWLSPEGAGTGRRALRSLCGVGGWMLVGTLASLPAVPEWIREVLIPLGYAWVIAAVIAVLVDRSARGLSFRAARCGIVDPRAGSLSS